MPLRSCLHCHGTSERSTTESAVLSMIHPTKCSLLTCLPAVSKKKYVSMPKQATSSHTIAASIKPRPGTKPNSFRTPSPETRRGGKTESLRGEVKMKSTGAWWNSLTCRCTKFGPTIASHSSLKGKTGHHGPEQTGQKPQAL